MLVEWMAQRVAELIHAADDDPSDDAARDRAMQAVLDLWGRRTDLPTWPPADAAAAVQFIEEGQTREMPWLPQTDPKSWGAAATRLQQLHDQEQRDLIGVVLANTPATARQWLGEPRAMTPEEDDFLARVARMRDQAIAEFSAELGASRTTKLQRADATLDKLERSARERLRVISSLRRDLGSK